MTIGEIILAKAAEKNCKNTEKAVADMLNLVQRAESERKQNDTRTDAERMFEDARTRRPARRRPACSKRDNRDPFQPGQKAEMRRVDLDLDTIIDFDSLDECEPVPNRDEPCFNASVSGSVTIEGNFPAMEEDRTSGTIIYISL